MSESIDRHRQLSLTVQEREKVAQVTAELVAVHVYRELQRANEIARSEAGCAIIGNCSNGSCNIIGNCSSSSKDVIVDAIARR
jgi:hypothetical protein